MNNTVRPMAVAGSFYPADSQILNQEISHYIQEAESRACPRPKFLVVPHAGYVYSGLPAAYAYRCLQPYRDEIKRIVLLGPAHRVALQGMAIPTWEKFSTPLGEVNLNPESLKQLTAFNYVTRNNIAHELEHSLEVQLPFLQHVLGEFSLVPLVVGACAAEDVAEAISLLWDGDETLIVCSTDLSHYHSYNEANEIDQQTCQKIISKENNIDGYQACGCYPLNGVLTVAGQKSMTVQKLFYCNSGDTGGDRRKVVGYGAFTIGTTER